MSNRIELNYVKGNPVQAMVDLEQVLGVTVKGASVKVCLELQDDLTADQQSALLKYLNDNGLDGGVMLPSQVW